MNSNKGMYIEQLVDRTILYYHFNKLGFLEKRQIPIKILKHINEKIVIATLTAKAKVDYFGFINNKYCEIECKQTVHEYFDINLIKQHQLDYLKETSDLHCMSIVLIYFEHYNKVVAIEYDKLMQLRKELKKKTIPLHKVVEFGTEIEIIYPGILDLIKLFQ